MLGTISSGQVSSRMGLSCHCGYWQDKLPQRGSGAVVSGLGEGTGLFDETDSPECVFSATFPGGWWPV